MTPRGLRRLAVVASATVAVLAAATISLPTSSAWTDQARLSATVSAGTWASTSGPVTPGNAITVLTDLQWTLVTNNPVQACFQVTVTTSSVQNNDWALTMDLSKPPFNGRTTGYQARDVAGQNVANRIAIAVDAAQQRATVTGTGSASKVKPSETIRFEICNWGLPSGVQTPSAYTVSVATTVATPTQVCKTATVTGNGTSQFYFAWELDLDMDDAYRALAHFSNWSVPTGNLWQVTQTTTGTNRFHLASTTSANLVGTQSFVLTYCANGWV